MKLSPDERCEHTGRYMIAHKCTTRQAAGPCGISKSTVHSDTVRLKKRNYALYQKVRKLLDENTSRGRFPK